MNLDFVFIIVVVVIVVIVVMNIKSKCFVIYLVQPIKLKFDASNRIGHTALAHINIYIYIKFLLLQLLQLLLLLLNKTKLFLDYNIQKIKNKTFWIFKVQLLFCVDCFIFFGENDPKRGEVRAARGVANSDNYHFCNIYYIYI